VDINGILSSLRTERDKLDRAIAALEGAASGLSRVSRAPARRKQGKLTSEWRRRISEAMKRRWAARRAGKSKAAASKAPAPKKRGGLTPAGRKRLSELMKKRWAERRKKSA